MAGGTRRANDAPSGGTRRANDTPSGGTRRANDTPSGGARRANDAWEALLSAHAALMKRFAAEDIWHDLSMREYDVLYTLSKHPEPLRIGELHRHVLLSQPALSRMVDRLVERGLVRRRADPADRRGVRLSLTIEGRDTQRRIGLRHARSVARAVTAKLDPDELRQLATICGKLAAMDDEREVARS